MSTSTPSLHDVFNMQPQTSISKFKAGMAKFSTDHKLPYSQSLSELNLDDMSSLTKTGQTYNAVVDFLNTLGHGNISREFWAKGAGKEGFVVTKISDDEVSSLHKDLHELCVTCGIPQDRITATMESLALILHRYTNDKLEEHFRTQSTQLTGMRSLASIYPASVMADASYSGALMGREMFGANSSQMITDIKTAMTITLLKGYKGITNRMMHRVANDTGMVQFVVPNDEFYDLAKSQAKTSRERDSWNHRNQLLTLHTRPEPVDMELIPVVPQKALDVDNKYLLADNILLPDVEINLWDLATVEGKVGYDQFNYTDLLSSKVTLRSIHVEITKGDPDAGGTKEQFILDLTPYSAMNTFTHMSNTWNNSADRVANFSGRLGFHKDTMTATGTRSSIFATLSQSVEYITGKMFFNAQVNLQSASVRGGGSMQFAPALSVEGAMPSTDLTNLLKDLKCEIIGWEINAFYSEENFRKTNMAVRSMSDVFTYSLPDGRTIVVDHSHNQSLPEHALGVSAEIQCIGIDHRNNQIAMKTLKSTADRVKNERQDKRYIENFDNITTAKAFVSGRKINPMVAIKTIDFNNVENFRSSDVLSDLWTYMRACMNTITTELHYRSLLLQQTEDAAPHYKVLTTTPIIDCLWALASIHENQMQNGKAGEMMFDVKTPGKPVEFKTTLPNGTVLEFVTTAFHYMEDTMMVIPYRPNAPQSDLNFMVNYDGGQYSVNWSPTDGHNATTRRSMQNTREYPVALCGLGAIITVVNRDKYWTGIGSM